MSFKALRPVLTYSYNYDYLPPLAMSNGLQISNLPTLTWLKLVLDQLVKSIVNGLVSKIESKEDQLKADIIAKATAEAEAIVKNYTKIELDNLGEAEKLFESVLGKFQGILTAAQGLAQYNEQFATIPLPANASTFQTDAYFSNLRVAGFNPLTLTRVTSLPAKFPLSQAQFQKAPGFENDTLSAALADGRLYFVDYEVLQLQPGQNPAPKQVYQPMGVFGVPQAGGPLAVIAVQGGQDPATFPIYGPGDGENWLKVKTAFDTADGNYHELISHLGRTHLLLEPFIVATHQAFHRSHPVFKIVVPSLEGTDFINAAAVDSLVAPGGSVDQLLMGTIESDLQVSANSVLEPGFNALMLPAFLEARGLNDPRLIYPYRDDAQLVWTAVKEWVTSYLGLYYTNDAAVLADKQLQKWAATLVAEDGGRVRGFGQDGQIKTLAYLIDAVTMILFTAGPQHAAVNFAQDALMSYTPGAPLAGYQPLPNQPNSSGTWLSQLPSLEMAAKQLNLGFLLGSVYYTRLGEYNADVFTDPNVQPLLLNFQASLARIENEINTRNSGRAFPYTFLLPSLTPISINI